MDPGPLRDLLTVVVGVATGVLSGTFGVGGAVISTPGIRALGASALAAIGTTLPSILPGAVSGGLRYHGERGLIDWRVVRITAPAGIGASILGSLLAPHVPGHGHVLQILTAGLLGYVAYRMLRTSDDEPAEDVLAGTPPHAPVELRTAPAAAVGAIAGGLSGLLGIGGGIVLVPGFVQLAGMRVKQAIATSLVCVGIFAVPGTITHAALGNVDWRFALWLTVGVIPGASLGAALTLRAADHRVRLTVGTFLAVTAVIYAAGELRSLL